jgi:hypothetical protein
MATSLPNFSTFFGLDPSILQGPAASSSLTNQLLFGSSFQMVPVDFGPFYAGIPPFFGGNGFAGFSGTIPFNLFQAQPGSFGGAGGPALFGPLGNSINMPQLPGSFPGVQPVFAASPFLSGLGLQF